MRLGVRSTKAILVSLNALGSFSCLTSLTVYLPPPPYTSFFRLLSNCPHLASLTITSFITESESAHSMEVIPQETIPLLRFYEGPVYFGLLLIPGRPVESIKLSFFGGMIKDPLKIIACVAKVTVPLHRLSISGIVKPSLQFFSVIDSLFPSLKCLSMSVHDSDPDTTASDDDSDDDGSYDDPLSDYVEYPKCITPEADDELVVNFVNAPSYDVN